MTTERIKLVNEIKCHLEENVSLSELKEIHEEIFNRDRCKVFMNYKKSCKLHKEMEMKNEARSY